MVVDTTLQFAARRNVPVRYDRDLVAATLRAMERVSEIRARRERAFYKKRMAGKRARELADARKLVAENSHLLPVMRGSERRRLRLAAEAEGMLVDADGVAVQQAAKTAPARVKLGSARTRQRMLVDGTTVEEMEVGGGGSDGSDGESGDESDDFEGFEGGDGDEEILVD